MDPHGRRSELLAGQLMTFKRNFRRCWLNAGIAAPASLGVGGMRLFSALSAGPQPPINIRH
jgi:hypothetical protein